MITNFESAILSRLALGEKSAWELRNIGYFHDFGNLASVAVFPTLKFMERDGLVRSRWLRNKKGERLRLFAITSRGEKIFRKNLAV